MKTKLFASLLLGCSIAAHADLQPLDTSQMQSVQAQGGATIDWQLSLNQTTPGVFDTATCSDLRFCRLAIAFNNRYDTGSYLDNAGTAHAADGSTISAITGNKQWVVFKGIQGSIHLPAITINGTDLAYSNDSNAQKVKAALQFGFDATKPIEIRNLGFQSMSIETDDASTATAGYLAMGSGGSGASAYSGGKYTTAGYDQGRETGFMGLSINGNLAVQGTLKVFSCDAAMKRC